MLMAKKDDLIKAMQESIKAFGENIPDKDVKGLEDVIIKIEAQQVLHERQINLFWDEMKKTYMDVLGLNDIFNVLANTLIKSLIAASAVYGVKDVNEIVGFKDEFAEVLKTTPKDIIETLFNDLNK